MPPLATRVVAHHAFERDLDRWLNSESD